MSEVIVHQWPDGKESLLFQAIEGGRMQWICWTPSPTEFRVLRQTMSALSQIVVNKAGLR